MMGTAYDPYGDVWYTWCEVCHDPDGAGVGRCDSMTATAGEGVEWYVEHCDEVHEDNREEKS